MARRLPVDQPRRTVGVEAQHPIAHRLKTDFRDPGRVVAGAPVIIRRKRQKRMSLRQRELV